MFKYIVVIVMLASGVGIIPCALYFLYSSLRDKAEETDYNETGS